jgi:hypothetical protein
MRFSFSEFGPNRNNNGVLLIEFRNLEPGTFIWSRYRNVDVSRHDVIGTMYLAAYCLLGQLQAVEFISGEPSQDARFRMRFLHQAQAAIKLRQPNVVEVVDLCF